MKTEREIILQLQKELKLSQKELKLFQNKTKAQTENIITRRTELKKLASEIPLKIQKGRDNP